MPSSTSSYWNALIASSVTVVAVGGTAYLYNNKTKKKKKYSDDETPLPSKEKVWQQRQAHFSKSMSVSYSNSDPLMLVEGTGARLIDHNGVSYLDTRNNVGHVGHSHPVVAEAVARQVAKLNTNTRYLHPNVTQLAERLLQKMPRRQSRRQNNEDIICFDQVFFCNSGSEANDLALRLARAFAGTNHTIVVDGAYHGHTLATLELSPHSSSTKKKYNHKKIDTTTTSNDDHFVEEHKLDTTNADYYDNHKGSEFHYSPGSHITKVPCPDVYRGIYRDPQTASAQYVQTVQNACRTQVSAFVCESILGVGGAIVPPPGYLEGCAKAVRDAGGLYIADEVQTGFGRCGECFWAFEYGNGGGVIPDIVTVGKPFGNGIPLAAVITSRRITQAFETTGVEYFNTFGGNPVSAAAGLAVLDVMEREHLQDRALHVGRYLKHKFEVLQQMCSWIGDVRGVGLFLGVELVHNRKTREPAANVTSWLSSVLKEKYRILTSIDGLAMNVLVIKPPLAFSCQDADYFVDSVQAALMEDLPQALQNGDLNTVAKTPT